MVEIAAGIDIGGTNSAIGLVDTEGNCIASSEFDTKNFKTPEEFVKHSCSEISNLISSVKDKLTLKGIGIGVPNGNYYEGTVEFAPNLPWKGKIEFAKLFRDEFDLPVVLTNDANAAAIGEMMYGAAKGMKDFIVVTLGTGLGSGFIANGKLIYGHDGFAGELGHVIAVRDGRMCGCGRKGCLEQYASATGMVKTLKERLTGNNDSSLLREKENINSKDIYEAALKVDEIALWAFDYTAEILGKTLADAVAITSPEAIILFGGLAQSGELISIPVKKYMEDNLLEVFKNKVKILISSIPGNNAAVLGSSALVWQEISG